MQANYTTRINPKSDWGTWEGWGTSLAWWAKAFGDRDDLADIFFTMKCTSYCNYPLPGLGLNIVRYNAGASSGNVIDGNTYMQGLSIPDSRRIDGYWLDWYSLNPQSSSWNWSVDSPQRNMMLKARDRGANRFELFSNSPMWWMLYNHNPAGADNGGDNLQEWNWQKHSVYLATIAKYAHDNWGINFESVEPFNEPISTWWKFDNNQEGCHFEHNTQAIVIKHLREELDKCGLKSMVVSASDENKYDQALSTWNSFDNATKSSVGRINVHGYQTDGRRDLLYTAAAADNKKIWNSEYGDCDASGMELATNLNYDFRWLHPTAWIYWQVLDGSNWGLINADIATIPPTTTSVNPKYFVLAQYSRHIRPGMHIIDGGEANTVAAYDPKTSKLVIVTTNYDNGQWISFDLSAYSNVKGVDGLVHRWATNTGKDDKYGNGDKYRYYKDTRLNDKKFGSWFAPNTVQTFEIENIVP